MEDVVYQRMAELEQRHWWFCARRQILASLLERAALPNNASILEVGSGTGGNLALLKEFGQVQALEPDPQARALCQQHYGIKPLEATLPGALPFAEKQFDLIALLDVLEHIPDDEAALATLVKHLKPGGSLLLTVPAFAFLWSQHDEQHHHQRRYRRGPLLAQLKRNGVEIDFASYFNTWLFPPIAAVRVMKKLFGKAAAPDDRLPSKGLNLLLQRLFASERHLLRYLSLPFGVSLVVVARRPAEEAQ